MYSYLVAGTDDPSEIEAALLLTQTKGGAAGILIVWDASSKIFFRSVFKDFCTMDTL
jgi:hypothetical protein